MRIDIEWLGEMLQRNLDPEQLAEQLTLGGLEVESVRLAGTAEVAGVDGVVLDFDITPNRGDCFSVLGIAREVSALNGKRMEPLAVPEVPAIVKDTFPVTLATPVACPRFAGRIIRNIETGCHSPEWLRLRLERAGLRALHPVVDVTNYVMLELGQPLHGYDLHALAGGISVRFAEDGEPLTLLDGNRITLQSDVLVIADHSGAIGLAGIMGGQGTAVSEATRDVFLESAFFSPDFIAGRPRRFGLHTDASLRFERGVDPVHQGRAIERATSLLLDIAGGEPGPLVEAVAEKELPQRKPVPLRLERLNSILGTSLEAGEVDTRLDLLHIAATRQRDGWSAVPPQFRFDLQIEEDLVEEVGRLTGYDNIPVVAEQSPRHVGLSTETKLPDERIADALCARGYSEVVTYAFVDRELADAVNPGADHVSLTNPLSQEMGVMRHSLWPGLLLAAQHNRSRQQARVRLFEIGTQFARGADGVRESQVLAGLAIGAYMPEHWEGGARDVDFFDVKSDMEAILALAGRAVDADFRHADHPALAAGKSARLMLGDEGVGWLGVLHPRLQGRMGWKRPAILFAMQLERAARARVPRYREYSKFPSLRRDIAAVVDDDVSADRLLQCVRRAAGDVLHDVTIFDIYRGRGIDSGRKSVALGLILQDRSRTLTDTEADRIVASTTRQLERDLKATIRE
ncbi:MAG: phenylalanine--tRNA ligase subunit beta [Rhodospirillaceae bacterium]|nr:phenylalanine--tRNA ligase subunit beta [Rhodospirillaceae bacterium]